MGFDIKEYDSDKFSVFLKSIETSSEETLKRTIIKASEVAKAEAENQLRRIETPRKRKNNRPAMHADVKITSGKNSKKVGGSKKTGTLWHIVNDGTYRTRAHHFMDNTIQKLDNEIDEIINESDQELR